MRTSWNNGVRRGAIALTLLTALVVTFGIAAPVAAADGRPPGGTLSDPLVRELDIAAPAVVRIVTLYQAHITLSLCGQSVTLPASSSGYQVGGSGSGAFISAHGDILTADHVVDAPPEALDQTLFQDERSALAIAQAINNACHPTVPIQAQDVQNGIVQYNGIAYQTKYSKPRTTVWRSTSYTGALSKSSSQDIDALFSVPNYVGTVEQSSRYTQDDVAIVHVDLQDTPSIALDSTASVADADHLAILGFPGNGDLNDDPTNLLTPSANNISVSAIKQNDNGSPLIQVGGNVEHGDSGGPAIDSQGRIVGIVSFSYVNGNEPGSTAFLRSSASALKVIDQANVDMKPGPFQRLWRQALTDYAATYSGHWHKAASELSSLSHSYLDFHAVQPYLQYAQGAAAQETLAESIPQLPLIIGAGGGVALLLILATVLAVVIGRRRRRSQAAVPARASMPLPQGYGYNAQGYNGGSPAYPQSPYGQGTGAGYGWPAAPSQGYAAPPTSPQYPPREPVFSRPERQPHPFSNPQQPPAGGPPGWSWETPGNGYDQPANGAGQGANYCLNGHKMPPDVVRCPLCGASRTKALAPQAREQWHDSF
jgi:S1-C subfamily serine protease